MILGMTKYDKFVAISLIIEFMSHKNPYKRPLLKSNRSHHSQLKLPMVDKKLSYDVKPITKVKSGKLACHKLSSQQGQLSILYGRCASELMQDLPLDIEQKVNKILNSDDRANEYYNSTTNFQNNIQKHKAMLKKQRYKRESTIEDHQEHGNNLSKENKILSKPKLQKGEQGKLTKRENSKIKLKQVSKPIRSRIEHISLREESKLTPNHQMMRNTSREKQRKTNRLEKKMKFLKQKIAKRTGQKFYTEHHNENPSYNLFDSIHNYLSNPHKTPLQHMGSTSQSRLRHRRQILQEKLRIIQSKHSHTELEETELREDSIVEGKVDPKPQYCITEWRRVYFKPLGGSKRLKRLSVDSSTFERQVSHLNKLQLRNEHSLQRFIENQRLLHSLNLTKKLQSKQQLKRQFLSK